MWVGSVGELLTQIILALGPVFQPLRRSNRHFFSCTTQAVELIVNGLGLQRAKRAVVELNAQRPNLLIDFCK